VQREAHAEVAVQKETPLLPLRECGQDRTVERSTIYERNLGALGPGMTVGDAAPALGIFEKGFN